MPQSEFHMFLVPDGSAYLFVEKRNKINLENILSDHFNFVSKFDKFRIILENQQDSEIIQNKIKNISKFENFKIDHYHTNFYQMQLSGSISRDLVSPDKRSTFSEAYEFEEVKWQNSLQIEIALDFILNSFGVDFSREFKKNISKPNLKKQNLIRANFKKSLLQSNLYIYLVKNYSGEYIGCFSLVNLESEVQLHSVAGISSKPLKEKVKKLPILFQSVLKIITSNPQFQSREKLTLSSSKPKVAEIYESLGMKKDEFRGGLILHKTEIS